MSSDLPLPHVMLITTDSATVEATRLAIIDMAKLQTATNIDVATDFANKSSTEILLIDLDSVGVTGSKVFNRIATNQSINKINVFFISSDAGKETECLLLGAEYIANPINSAALRIKISRKLSSSLVVVSDGAGPLNNRNSMFRISNFISTWGADDRLIYHNDEKVNWFGINSIAKHSTLIDFVEKESKDAVKRALKELKEVGSSHFDAVITTLVGLRQVQVCLVRTQDSASALGFVVVMTDLHHKKNCEIADSEEKVVFISAVTSNSNDVLVFDEHGCVKRARSNGSSRKKEEKNVFSLFHFSNGAHVGEPGVYAIDNRKYNTLPTTVMVSIANGNVLEIEELSTPLRSDEGDIMGAVTVYHDVTEKRKMKRDSLLALQHDEVTGLPNKVLLMDRLEQAIKASKRNKTMVALLSISINGVDEIKKAHGEAAANKLVQENSEKIKCLLRGVDTVARNGYDGFTVMLTEVDSINYIGYLCIRLMKYNVQNDMQIDPNINTSMRVGVSVSGFDSASSKSMLRRAEAALNGAKLGGGYQFFSIDMRNRLSSLESYISELGEAIENGDIKVYFQPKVNAVSRKIEGVEALARWQKGGGELILPEKFISLAEQTGLIIPLGEHVLNEACRCLEVWHDIDPELTMSLNVSAKQFNAQFVEKLKEAIERFGLKPNRLELEVKEFTLANNEAAIDIVNKCKSLGVKICLDDYGKGFYSLDYLKKYPIDILKVDQSFVLNMLEDKKDKAIVQTVVSLAEGLNMEPVVQGVETMLHAEELMAVGCMSLQGFYYCRPVDEVKMRQMIGHPVESSDY